MHPFGRTVLVVLFGLQQCGQAIPIPVQQPSTEIRTKPVSTIVLGDPRGFSQRRVEEWIGRHSAELNGAGTLGLGLALELHRRRKQGNGRARSRPTPRKEKITPAMEEERRARARRVLSMIEIPEELKRVQRPTPSEPPSEPASAQPSPPTEINLSRKGHSFTLADDDQALRNMSPEERASRREEAALLMHIMNRWDLQFALCFAEKTIPEEGDYPNVNDETVWDRIWTECEKLVGLQSNPQPQLQPQQTPQMSGSSGSNVDDGTQRVSEAKRIKTDNENDGGSRNNFLQLGQFRTNDIFKHAAAAVGKGSWPPKLNGEVVRKSIQDVASAAAAGATAAGAYGSRHFRMPKLGMGGIVKPV